MSIAFDIFKSVQDITKGVFEISEKIDNYKLDKFREAINENIKNTINRSQAQSLLWDIAIDRERDVIDDRLIVSCARLHYISNYEIAIRLTNAETKAKYFVIFEDGEFHGTFRKIAPEGYGFTVYDRAKVECMDSYGNQLSKKEAEKKYATSDYIRGRLEGWYEI